MCAAPGAAASTANCDYVIGDLTDVGSYAGVASSYGAFDQGGERRGVERNQCRRFEPRSSQASDLDATSALFAECSDPGSVFIDRGKWTCVDAWIWFAFSVSSFVLAVVVILGRRG